MTFSKSPEAYPDTFPALMQVLASGEKPEYRLKFDSLKEATKFRLKYYSYLRAVEKTKSSEVAAARRYSVILAGTEVVCTDRNLEHSNITDMLLAELREAQTRAAELEKRLANIGTGEGELERQYLPEHQPGQPEQQLEQPTEQPPEDPYM